MKLNSQVICKAIKESEGEYEGRAFSSTTFHLLVDLPDNNAGRSIGEVTRPFKFGDAAEFDKWAHLKNSWPVAGLLCDCVFDVVAGSGNDSKLTLLSIKPVPQSKGG